MSLPESERALLVAELDASLAPEGAPEEIEREWAAELDRRADEALAGRSEGRDAQEVIAELRAELAARR